MNARKYVSQTKVSKATATRDLQQLVDLGVFPDATAPEVANILLKSQ